ncbi:MAG: histidine phosphatase family protein [Clostridiales bacterium]|jgi:broad specificity phosphatase PhoE|nr:histidine phosphatase family protein [Clostridiales bacterium]
MKLIITRHGQTIWNTQLRTQGRTDIPLNDMGRLQSGRFAALCKPGSVSAIYCSPLQRARETAAIIGDALCLTPRDSRWMLERDFGEWEGRPFSELETLFPRDVESWLHDPAGYTPPGAEPLTGVLSRCIRLIDELKTSHTDAETILLVGHSIPLKLTVMYLVGMDVSHIHNIVLDNASYTEVELLQTYNRVLTLNNTSHLRGIA